MTGYVVSSEIVFWTGSTKHSPVRNAESPSESRRLQEQELKRITDPVPVATKPNAPFSEPKKQASGCKPHQVTSIQLASLVWNSDMHCIFEIVEDHLIIPFIAMDVELTSPWLMTLHFKLHEIKHEFFVRATYQGMYPRITHPHYVSMRRMSQHSQWEDGAGLSLF